MCGVRASEKVCPEDDRFIWGQKRLWKDVNYGVTFDSTVPRACFFLRSYRNAVSGGVRGVELSSKVLT